MTRKDYELIAAAITRATESANQQDEYILQCAALDGIQRAAIALACGLHADNPRFDHARFLRACGF
jgi:hypothetical protein